MSTPSTPVASPAPPRTAPPAAGAVSQAPVQKYAYPMPHLGKETVDNTQSFLRFVILACIAGASVASRLFAVIRFESVIHEFDPWFNYRATKILVEKGFYEFWNWFDPTAWYPLGRTVGGTVYPGIMVTSGIIWSFLKWINCPVDIRNVCVMLAPAFSGLTALATYLCVISRFQL